MLKHLVFVIAVAAMCSLATADTYTDNTGNHLMGGDLHDFFHSQGFNHLDIAQVTVTNDTNFLYFAIDLVGDIDATNWGKYIVGIDRTPNTGDGDNSTDPGSWNRNVDWGRGITDFIGSWADDGGSGAGAELRQWDGATWNLTDATYIGNGDIFASDAGHPVTQTLQVSLSSLGLVAGDTFEFDVFSSGGGADPGVDHLSRSDFSTDDWANQSVAGVFLRYTVQVPEPASAGLLGLLATTGLMIRRRK